MYNWSVDIKQLKKYPQKYTLWRLEQLINFGLGGERLKLTELKRYFSHLKIDSQKRKYLKFLLSSS